MPYKNQEKRREISRLSSARMRKEKPGWSTGKNKKWQNKYPEKRAAHKAVEKALRIGILVRRPCCVCGSDKSQAHHEDYKNQLDVIWVCQKHHVEIHKKALTLEVPGLVREETPKVGDSAHST